MKCERCLHMATKTTPAPAQFLLYGCRLKKITFGVYSDMMKLKKDDCEKFNEKAR